MTVYIKVSNNIRCIFTTSDRGRSLSVIDLAGDSEVRTLESHENFAVGGRTSLGSPPRSSIRHSPGTVSIKRKTIRIESLNDNHSSNVWNWVHDARDSWSVNHDCPSKTSVQNPQ